MVSDAQHTTRRNGRRRDRWEHRHWPSPCVSIQGLQMRDIHAQHSGALSRASITEARTLTRRRRLQSQEKIDLLRMLGAEVHPVPAVPFENPQNYNHQARAYAAQLDNAIWTDQFDNTANAYAHYLTTGPEVWTQTQGGLDGFVCSTGTGGTLAGVGKYLKEKSGGKTQVWLADPPGSVLHAYLSSGGKLIERKGSSITEGVPIPIGVAVVC